MTKINKLMEELSGDAFRNTRDGLYNHCDLAKDCLAELNLEGLTVYNKGDDEPYTTGSQVLYVLQYQILSLHKRIEELENKDA